MRMYRVHSEFIWSIILFIFQYSRILANTTAVAAAVLIYFSRCSVKQKILWLFGANLCSNMESHEIVYCTYAAWVCVCSSTHKLSVGRRVHHFGNLWYIAADEHNKQKQRRGEQKLNHLLCLHKPCLHTRAELRSRWVRERYSGRGGQEKKPHRSIH